MTKLVPAGRIRLRRVFLLYFVVVCALIVVLRHHQEEYAEKYLKVEYYIIIALLCYILVGLYSRNFKRRR